jgi:hypothetical protein
MLMQEQSSAVRRYESLYSRALYSQALYSPTPLKDQTIPTLNYSTKQTILHPEASTPSSHRHFLPDPQLVHRASQPHFQLN